MLTVLKNVVEANISSGRSDQIHAFEWYDHIGKTVKFPKNYKAKS